jgi:hypothetical protein
MYLLHYKTITQSYFTLCLSIHDMLVTRLKRNILISKSRITIKKMFITQKRPILAKKAILVYVIK